MPQSTVKNLDLASSLTVDDPTKALRLVDDYLKNDPLNSSAILTKYHAQQNLGLWSDALDTAGKLANVSSDKSLCYLLQADMLYHLGRYDEAIGTARQAIATDNDNFLSDVPHRLIALCHAVMGDKPKALAAANNIPELEKDEFLAPVGAIPAGTKSQYTAMISRMADHVVSGRDFTPPKRTIFQ